MAVEGTSAPEQSVLLVLAVMANDDRQCWPAINGTAGLTGKTKLSERAVQMAVKALAAAGHITRNERPGKGVLYTVHPRTSCTPAHDAPPQESHPGTTCTPAGDAPTPAPPAPKQPRTTNSVSSSGASACAKPDEVTDGTWADFTALRRQQRAPPTPTALAGIAREATKAGWTMERALSECCTRGWRGFKAEWVAEDRNGRNGQHGMAGHRGGGPAPGRAPDGFTAALREMRGEPAHH